MKVRQDQYWCLSHSHLAYSHEYNNKEKKWLIPGNDSYLPISLNFPRMKRNIINSTDLKLPERIKTEVNKIYVLTNS